jgi:prevent-host-death family protein
MREMGAFEAKNKLAEILDAVEGGEEVTITRRGKPVARLIGMGDDSDRTRVRAAAQRIKELSKGITLGDGLTIRDLIDEGRR